MNSQCFIKVKSNGDSMAFPMLHTEHRWFRCIAIDLNHWILFDMIEVAFNVPDSIMYDSNAMRCNANQISSLHLMYTLNMVVRQWVRARDDSIDGMCFVYLLQDTFSFSFAHSILHGWQNGQLNKAPINELPFSYFFPHINRFHWKVHDYGGMSAQVFSVVGRFSWRRVTNLCVKSLFISFECVVSVSVALCVISSVHSISFLRLIL